MSAPSSIACSGPRIPLAATWWGAVALVLAVAFGPAAAPARSQGEPAQTPAEADAGSSPADEQEHLGDERSDLGTIDDILAGDEESLAGGGYGYEPGERRDPFKSLLAASDRPALRGPRPEGIAGLLIDELRVTGIFQTGQGWVTQVQAGNKQRGYLLKEGDQLYDGDVVSIAQNEVVFKQIVQDPTALKPFREVVKKLNP